MYLGAGLHENVVDTTEDTGSKLRPEGILCIPDVSQHPSQVPKARACAYPDSVLGLCSGGAVVVLGGVLDGNSLLAVDGFARVEVGRSKQVLLSASRDEDAFVTMRLLNHG